MAKIAQPAEDGAPTTTKKPHASPVNAGGFDFDPIQLQSKLKDGLTVDPDQKSLAEPGAFPAFNVNEIDCAMSSFDPEEDLEKEWDDTWISDNLLGPPPPDPTRAEDVSFATSTGAVMEGAAAPDVLPNQPRF